MSIHKVQRLCISMNKSPRKSTSLLCIKCRAFVRFLSMSTDNRDILLYDGY